MITLGGFSLAVPYPVEANDRFWEDFLGMLDGQAVGIGSTLTIPATKMFGTYQWDTATGSVATLPAATGSLMRVMLYVKTLATSNSHILYCNLANGGGGSDVFVGIIAGMNNSTGATTAFAAASTSNTVTLNRTNTGSVSKGEHVEVIDVASGIWLVRGLLSASGAAFVTPFSHT